MKTRAWLALAWGLVLLAVSERPAAAFYDPQAGRWLNRDPIEEQGGVNLSAFPGTHRYKTYLDYWWVRCRCFCK